MLGFFQSDHSKRFFDFLCNEVGRFFANTQTIGHVIENLHVREQSVVLEYEAHAAFIGRDFCDVFVSQKDLALRRSFKTCDHAQSGSFTAAGRS